ncbi:MAG: hypothetical protein JW797_02795 [Bradymonadales bacterium]|nr:hypothetical protein [Bradymonadales bacterium]
MTFYEAAIEILKNAGRPLHYKKITELAIKQNLLSHIGKTPEVTMQARLNQEAQKEWGSAICRVRPGVFVLVKDVELADVKETVSQPTIVSTPQQQQEPAFPRPAPRGGATDRGPQRRPATAAVPGGDDAAGKQRPLTDQLEPPGVQEEPAVGAGLDPLTVARQLPWPLGGSPLEPSIGDAVLETLRRATGPLSTQELASAISPPTGPKVPLNSLELYLAEENRRRLQLGVRPRFIRQGGGWMLVDKLLDAKLKAHFNLLEGSCVQINTLTEDALAQRLEKLSPTATEAVVLATFKGLEFSCRLAERREPWLTLEIKTHQPLFGVTVVVRLWQSNQPLTGEEVAALRGQLHHYGATHGVLLALSGQGVEESAYREASCAGALPIAVLDAKSFAPLLLKAKVGVVTYLVEVPILDATWFS